MEPLFRFVLVRPAIEPRSPTRLRTLEVVLGQNSPFQKALAAALTAETPKIREAVKGVTTDFANRRTIEEFISSPSETPFARQLDQLDDFLNDLITNKAVNRQAVIDAVTKAFGEQPSSLVRGGKLDTARARLRDTILAIKYDAELHRIALEALCNQLRLLEMIVHITQDATFPVDGTALTQYRDRAFELPDFAIPIGSVLATTAFTEASRDDFAKFTEERQKRIDQLLIEYTQHDDAIKELIKLPREQFEMPVAKPKKGVAVDPKRSLEKTLGMRWSMIDSISTSEAYHPVVGGRAW